MDQTNSSVQFPICPKPQHCASWQATPRPLPDNLWLLLHMPRPLGSNIWFWFSGFLVHGHIPISDCELQYIQSGTLVSWFDGLAALIVKNKREMLPAQS
jgi:hypothetical protein